MNYSDLMKPNFLEKRRFLYEHINHIPSSQEIKYIFLDEAQDLERNVELYIPEKLLKDKL